MMGLELLQAAGGGVGGVLSGGIMCCILQGEA